MAATPPRLLLDTFTPFLCPCLFRSVTSVARNRSPVLRKSHRRAVSSSSLENSHNTTFSPPPITQRTIGSDWNPISEHLDPSSEAYSITPFTDRCTITLQAGNGGHGCVSFLREKYIPEGPPNGGDGGHGGAIYVQALRNETSLHKLARQGLIKAGRGQSGRGKGQGGQRGEDVVFTVPVGTVIREVSRINPVEEAKERAREARWEAWQRGEDHQAAHDEFLAKDKWVVYPGVMQGPDLAVGTQRPPKVQRYSAVAAAQPPGPIRLDLDTPMDRPMLLAAGALGGNGNAAFITRDIPRPKFAMKGEPGLTITLELELKVLADVGLVGLPNAGKSTLLRALTNSRTRIGNWAFTTLQPSIGTLVLDDHKGRPFMRAFHKTGEARTGLTIADIPGLIEDAHLDKGLGLGFLRHVERAAVLAFVVDLSAGDAVVALKALWREVGEYETLRNKEISAESERTLILQELESQKTTLPPKPPPPISSKPWFVVATKADLPDTQANFDGLVNYVEDVKVGRVEHPSGRKNAWKIGARAVPISAIKAEGVQAIPKIVLELLG